MPPAAARSLQPSRHARSAGHSPPSAAASGTLPGLPTADSPPRPSQRPASHCALATGPCCSPGCLSTAATVPSLIESPIAGTTTLTASAVPGLVCSRRRSSSGPGARAEASRSACAASCGAASCCCSCCAPACAAGACHLRVQQKQRCGVGGPPLAASHGCGTCLHAKAPRYMPLHPHIIGPVDTVVVLREGPGSVIAVSWGQGGARKVVPATLQGGQ
jgi:hypothetical protein